MQRLANPSLPHVLPLNIPLTNIQIRSMSKFRRRGPPNVPKEDPTGETLSFNATALLLDLDSEDSPYVRPFDKTTLGEPAPLRYEKFRRTRLERFHANRFQKTAEMYANDFKGVRKDRFSVWRISDYDVLSFILDSSFEDEQTPAQEIEQTEQTGGRGIDARLKGEKSSIIKWNGIPERKKDVPADLVSYVLRRQLIARRLHPGSGDSESLRRALLKVSLAPEPEKRLLSYERIIEGVIQTPEGSKLVSDCSKVLGSLCKDIAPKIPPKRLLPFLNNVVINLNSRGLPISPALLWCGYQVSYEGRSWHMFQKYMGMVREEGFDAGPRFIQVHHAFQQIMAASTKPRRGMPHTILYIYGLLTGRLLGEDSSHPSFHDHLSCFTRTQFTGYLASLAQLGAFRSMWYIWRMFPEDMGNDPTSRILMDKFKVKPFSKARAFAQAISYAVQVNSRSAEVIQAPGFTHVAEDRDKNCELELQTIMTSADLLLPDIIKENSKLLPKCFIANQHMINIFEEKSLQEAMSALQSYLLDKIPTLQQDTRPTEEQ
ncbi:uncharacterized protein GGS22DRAFT_157134 [Annulohypoxylon maeteangense]|uniref:uncharacterized protein n=1 Tax=Annulohypoxylon maeteangense TaxID=1927788 RepID=UPI0020078C65|nr:uncharacterized protein GGS22DRAFT_157134 [Annulohypoxylon maeteangense]KAI0887418.1 hypothetical protein GGS22DRAFT_157134 [Annulohypoxylon maeteangense]